MSWIADFINDTVVPAIILVLLVYGLIQAAIHIPAWMLRLETENCSLTGKAIERETKYEKRVGCLVKNSKNEWVLISTYRVVE